jgi:hypothetical protein
MTHGAGAKSPAHSSFPLSCHPQKLRACLPREPRPTNGTSDRKANGEIRFLTSRSSTCGEADAGMPDPNTIKKVNNEMEPCSVGYSLSKGKQL